MSRRWFYIDDHVLNGARQPRWRSLPPNPINELGHSSQGSKPPDYIDPIPVVFQYENNASSLTNRTITHPLPTISTLLPTFQHLKLSKQSAQLTKWELKNLPPTFGTYLESSWLLSSFMWPQPSRLSPTSETSVWVYLYQISRYKDIRTAYPVRLQYLSNPCCLCWPDFVHQFSTCLITPVQSVSKKHGMARVWNHKTGSPQSRRIWKRQSSTNGWIPLNSYLGISENSGFSPQIIQFNRGFHYKPSILGYPYFWKHPFDQPSVAPAAN